MKKYLLMAFAGVCIGFAAKAQKGSVLVFGNIGYAYTSANKASNFNLNPGVGYQMNDNWTIGGEFGLGSNKTTTTVTNIDGSTTSTDNKQSSFSVGPFARYTYTISDIFSVFGQGGVGYQNSKTGDVKSNGMYAKLFPAIFINVKKSFGLNFDFGGLSYGSMKPSGGGDSNNQFNFNFGKTINVGISKNF